jgi:hypothetical protein
MNLTHPFEKIGEGRIRFYCVPLVLLTLVILALFPWILPNREAHTLVDLVEAGTPEAAATVLSHWSDADRIKAAFGVGLDFVLNPAYASVGALVCIWASRSFARVRWPRASRVGVLLAWLAWGVILTNLLENIALFRMLLGSFSSPWPQLASFAHYYAGAALFAGAVPYAIAAYLVSRRSTH